MMRNTSLCVAIVLLGVALAAGAPAVAQDPGNWGPYDVTERSYNFGDSAYRPPGFPISVEVRANVHHPSDLRLGPYPLVLFLHGRHVTCYSGSSSFLQWPCSGGRQPIPSFEGYDYLAERLASHGYIVVSVSANGINAYDNSVFDLGMEARAYLLQHHLGRWNTWNASGGSPFGSLFVGRVDLDNVGTMGHSRGGEGVVRHFELNRAQGEPYGLQAVLPFAPTDFNRTVANRVPLGVVLPYCDGDVNDLQGVHFYDDARYNVSSDQEFKHTFLVMGANHNYFNTVWTPGLFPAGARDDWTSSSDPHCGPSAADRLSAAEQRGAGQAYSMAFFRRYLSEETAYVDLLTSAQDPPLSAEGADVRVSYHAPASLRRDVNRLLTSSHLTTNHLGGSVTRSGLSPYALCGGESPQPQRCLPTQNDQRQPHTTPSARSSKRGLSQLELGWNSTSAYWRNSLPSGQRNLTGFTDVQFRVGIDFTDGRNPSGVDQDLSVRLTDGLGRVSSVRASLYSDALRYPPGSFSVVPKLFLNTVRIPLSRFSVDRSDVRSVELRFDRKTTGGVMVTDLAFSRTAPASSPGCCDGPFSEREIYLIGDSYYSVPGSQVSYCAVGMAQATATGGSCNVAYDAVEDEWEFITADANCLFQCIWKPSSCSSATPANFTREFSLIETSGSVSEQLTLNEDSYGVCALASSIPLTTNGYCYVNQDGDDDTWELIARGASCHFTCIPRSATCTQLSHREILFGSSGSLVLNDSAYPYCALGGWVPQSNGSGYCITNHDGDDDTWELSSQGAQFCNHFCLRD
ncbi:MAG: hypothetical protein AAGC60_08350 [Acidobacteriota bacterium]